MKEETLIKLKELKSGIEEIDKVRLSDGLEGSCNIETITIIDAILQIDKTQLQFIEKLNSIERLVTQCFKPKGE